jgi:hypothetical protein
MVDFEKEFYAHLGLLSVKFAQMDFKISIILQKLIGTDSSIGIVLTEKNSLHQNLELLKQINRIRDFEISSIANLVAEVSKIKSQRNLFIHGLWGNPYKAENDVMIICDEKRMTYSEKTNKSNATFKIWTSNKIHKFRLSYIKKLIRNIEDIIISQDFLIKKLENNVF